MRELLFSGKRKYGGEWVEGYLAELKAVDNKYAPVKTVIFPVGARCNWFDKYMYDTEEVIPETVRQYTGLTDKNSKKIFEGDIVKGYWGTVFVVYYDKDYLQYRAKLSNGSNREIDYYGDSTELEVIGNIHDNPELLEKDE